jgi:peroxiredoxin
MTRKLGIAAFGVLLAAAAFTVSQATAAMKSEAKAPEIGEEAPGFKLPTIGDGESVQLSDYRGHIVVLHFQSAKCPWDKGYQPILNDMASKYQAMTDDEGEPKVVFLGVNSNRAEGEKMLKKYHASKDMPYKLLKDEGNEVADKYNAMTTPHMYVIGTEGKLQYMGHIENNYGDMQTLGEKEPYLAPVLDALLAGEEPPMTKTRAFGCSIKRAS